jgi:hypothetical protein
VKHLKLTSAALAEEGDDIVLRGVIDPDTLDALRVDRYQREMESQRYIEDIAEGFKTHSVADIDLGMRGGDYDEYAGTLTLKNPVYVIDGFQRVSAARLAMSHGTRPVLGAALRFNTTFEWEKSRFHVLNARRKRVSPNIHLRNLRTDYPVVEMLHDLCNEQGFPLHERVCWQQNLRPKHLVTATTLLKSAGALQAHFGGGRSVRLEQLLDCMQTTMEKIGRANYRTNILVFFGVLEECWGVRRIAYREHATVLRGGFLGALAKLFDEHDEVWVEKRLVVPTSIRRKLASFPVTDPSVEKLASSAGPANAMLYELILKHLNAGRRTNRLVGRSEKNGAAA